MEPSSLVLLAIECNNLARGDVLSKADPYVIVLDNQPGSQTYLKEIGRTETIKNDQNPRFVTRIELRYFFEKAQKLLFKILDSDDGGKSSDALGTVEASLNEIVGAKGHRLMKNISGGAGVLIATVEYVPDTNSEIFFRVSGNGLDKKDFFGSSDPYLEIKRDQGGLLTTVFKTEVIKNNLNPVWKNFSLLSSVLCQGNLDLPLTFECYDWDSDGGHDLIGAFQASVNQIKATKSWTLLNPKKKGKGSGQIVFENVEVTPVSSFLDYLRGGCEIGLVVGIDFTASNMDPKRTDSLHYRNPVGPNEYMQAIIGIGQVVEPYDRDRLFPVFGFGAKLPNGKESYCFNCNMAQDPTVQGVTGMIDAYVKALNTVTLWGPTNFAPLLRQVIQIASAAPPAEQKYFILLITTDGDITDMEETIEAIITASNLPISIIIVGVGNSSFESMKILDGDDGRLGIRGKYVSRDIVQFVPFRAPNRTPENLAAEVLAEVPKQLLSYMKSKGLRPKNPVQN